MFLEIRFLWFICYRIFYDWKEIESCIGDRIIKELFRIICKNKN